MEKYGGRFCKKIAVQQCHVKEQYAEKWKICELQVQHWTKKKIQNVFFLDEAWFTLVGT
jgi:hypothetical protein